MATKIKKIMDIVKEITKQLIVKYRTESDVCMAEFLASEFPKNLSFQEAFEVYIACMKEVEGDKFFVEKEGKNNLSIW